MTPVTGRQGLRAPTASKVDRQAKTEDQFSAYQLIQACMMNSEAAWREFVRRFHPLISSVVTKTLRRCMKLSSTLVDDLVQETYVKLCTENFKALRRFECRHEKALAGFLKAVACNVTHDYLRAFLSKRRGSGQPQDDFEATLRLSDAAVPAQSMERQILVAQLQDRLQKELGEPNSARDVKIFCLYFRDGLTARDIAKRSDIRLGAKGVESALFRLTQFLRARFPLCIADNRIHVKPR